METSSEPTLAAAEVRITDVDVFQIELPAEPDELEAGKLHRYTVVSIATDAGICGYSFAGATHTDFSDPPLAAELEKGIRPLLVGQDLFAVQNHLRAGLTAWGAVEHALWDAIGKVAGQPVYRLLGGGVTTLKTYVTGTYLPGHTASEYAETALRLRSHGFAAMKILAWSDDPDDVVRACAEVRAACGDDFTLMVDRTAHWSGSVWDYETALSVARKLEAYDIAWFEEPFGYFDFDATTRLSQEIGIPLAGGEGYRGLEAFRRAIGEGSLAIVQPDAVIAGGILTSLHVGALADSWGRACVLHGAAGLSLAGWLHTSAALGAEWQELATITPPLLPEEQWSPALNVLRSDRVFSFSNGKIEVPDEPGLGLAVDEDAIAEFRTR